MQRLLLLTFYIITQLTSCSLSIHFRSRSAFREFKSYSSKHDKRATSSVNISMISLQQLQSEYTAFHGWIEAWLNSLSPNGASTSQIEQDLQAYDGWISSWLASATSTSNPLSIPSQALSTPSASSSIVGGLASVPLSVGATLMTPLISPTATSNGIVASVSMYPSSTGNFEKTSVPGNDVAVYYGQSNATAQVTLAQLCQNQNVDIVILAFLTTFFGPGGYPSVNFGAACNDNVVSAAEEKNATGLLSCPSLASDITACQAAGKKVMLSLGGALSTTAFSSDTQATAFATTIWNLFGSGTSDSDLRPFGPVKVDGFDIGTESN